MCGTAFERCTHPAIIGKRNGAVSERTYRYEPSERSVRDLSALVAGDAINSARIRDCNSGAKAAGAT